MKVNPGRIPRRRTRAKSMDELTVHQDTQKGVIFSDGRLLW